jgi:hypothetical protein
MASRVTPPSKGYRIAQIAPRSNRPGSNTAIPELSLWSDRLASRGEDVQRTGHTERPHSWVRMGCDLAAQRYWFVRVSAGLSAEYLQTAATLGVTIGPAEQGDLSIRATEVGEHREHAPVIGG